MANQLKNNLGIEAEPKVYPTFDELRKDVTDRTIKTPFRTGWQADYPSMLNYLGPIYAALVAWALLGEQPQWFHLVGAALILPGIWLATRTK